jgi:hypothetical protein
MKTYRFGNDCLGNTPHAVTMEGTCYQDIYAQKDKAYYNTQTEQCGSVYKGEDGELHFKPYPI